MGGYLFSACTKSESFRTRLERRKYADVFRQQQRNAVHDVPRMPATPPFVDYDGFGRTRLFDRTEPVNAMTFPTQHASLQMNGQSSIALYLHLFEFSFA